MADGKCGAPRVGDARGKPWRSETDWCEQWSDRAPVKREAAAPVMLAPDAFGEARRARAARVRLLKGGRA